MTLITQLTAAVARGKSRDTPVLTQQALDAGHSAAEIVDLALLPAMADVGERFKNHLIFVPEMLMAAKAMKGAMALLEPRLTAAGITPKHTAVIGTVQGDLHDIGKNLVAVMWRGANFKVVDLGTNVPPDQFVEAIRQHRPRIVGLSALLTTTMPAMVETVKRIRAAFAHDISILVGGAPLSASFASEIGADGYAADAGAAAELAQSLTGAN